jgi:hypothetical protein
MSPKRYVSRNAHAKLLRNRTPGANRQHLECRKQEGFDLIWVDAHQVQVSNNGSVLLVAWPSTGSWHIRQPQSATPSLLAPVEELKDLAWARAHIAHGVGI